LYNQKYPTELNLIHSSYTQSYCVCFGLPAFNLQLLFVILSLIFRCQCFFVSHQVYCWWITKVLDLAEMKVKALSC